MPGKKRDIIWFPTCPILYSQTRSMPPWGPVVVFSPLQRLSHCFVLAGRAASVMARCDPCLLLEGDSIFAPGIVWCAIPLSPVVWEPFTWREWQQCCVCSSLGTYTLSKASLPPLNLPRVWYSLWQTAGMGTAWLGALILGGVTGQCTRLLHVERNSVTLTPFILDYGIRTCLLCFVFIIFSTEPQEVYILLLIFFAFLSQLLNFK